MKKEIHLQSSGCSWNTVPVTCYVAFTTVVFVGNSAITYRTCAATQMIAICKMNSRKNKAIGREGGFFDICSNTVLIANNEFSFLLID